MTRVSSVIAQRQAQRGKGIFKMFELLDDAISRRSFTSLWYWIAVAVFWILMTRQVMGLPLDMVLRAKSGGAALKALEDMAHLQAQRLMSYWSRGQTAISAAMAALVAMLSMLAFWYQIELAKALWFLLVPWLLIMALSLRMARQILHGAGHGDDLLKLAQHFRLYLQGIGVVFIFANILTAINHILAARGFG
jgi:hypothetical protein